MAIIKCKMCGGDLIMEAANTIAECEYCGSRQTVPKADNDKKLTLFARANRLRAACEYDKAAGIYETIIADFPEEAEAYWGLVLCKFGIEYVDDPATGKKIPTCHRSSFDSIMDDSDFEQALENADGMARRVYREEAKAIEEIRKGIIAVSANEQPYDIFICYKETAENGERTLDSVLAQDIYDALIDKGYRVFFSRITLEDKLGMEYEPYIFAALNSAKIMLAFGTDYEHFNAVWVKNEWSRYLKLMAKDKEKHLIPCFKGIDAYDMPKEFAKLQAQDLGKMGATQDLLRGIEKILHRQTQPVYDVAPAPHTSNFTALLKRGYMALEDAEWDRANEFFEEVLNNDPECSDAYLGKVLSSVQCISLENYTEVRIAQVKALQAKTVFCLYDTDPDFTPENHINSICQKYFVEDFLDVDTIRSCYTSCNGYYNSLVPVYEQALEAERTFWQSNRSLQRAIRYAKTDLAGNAKATILSAIEQRLEQAKRDEQALKAKTQTEFRAALEQADAQAKAYYEDALERREVKRRSHANKKVPVPVEIENGELICPSCQLKQLGIRRVCWNCGQVFINGQSAPYWCNNCGKPGPYGDRCPDCGVAGKVMNR